MNTRSKNKKKWSGNLPKVTLEVRDRDEQRTQVCRLLGQRISLRAISYGTVWVFRFSRCCHLLNVLVPPPNAFTFFMKLDESLPPPDSFITPRNHYLPRTHKVILNCWCSNQAGAKDISVIDVPFSGKQLKVSLLWYSHFFPGLKVNQLTMLHGKSFLKLQRQRDCVRWQTLPQPKKSW